MTGYQEMSDTQERMTTNVLIQFAEVVDTPWPIMKFMLDEGFGAMLHNVRLWNRDDVDEIHMYYWERYEGDEEKLKLWEQRITQGIVRD